MSHNHHKRGWFFAWRLPTSDEAESFDVLVTRAWLRAGIIVTLAVFGGLFAVPRTLRLRALGFTLVGATMAAIGALAESLRSTMFPAVTRVTLPIRDLPSSLDGLRIAQLSDFHLGMPFSVQAVRRAVAQVAEAQPDVIVLTGDFVSFRRHIPLMREMLSGLQAPHGVYAIFGNHDYTTSSDAIAEALADLGFTLLVNEHRVLEVVGAHLVIAGIDDAWYGRPNVEAALAGAPEDAPVIMLAHSPDFADIAARSRAAVQLAGHTHAGHIRLPYLGSLVLPRHGIRYFAGLHRVGSMWLYINHGLGGIPLRFGTRAEISLITLVAEQR